MLELVFYIALFTLIWVISAWKVHQEFSDVKGIKHLVLVIAAPLIAVGIGTLMIILCIAHVNVPFETTEEQSA